MILNCAFFEVLGLFLKDFVKLWVLFLDYFSFEVAGFIGEFYLLGLFWFLGEVEAEEGV